MKRILLISDTHGYMDERILHYAKESDEVWHAGDIGNFSVLDELLKVSVLRAVYGNIDGHEVRSECPENAFFLCEGVRVFITHIGGYPGRYSKRIPALLDAKRPDVFITGHSHILKVMPDKKRNLLHMNPGACGNHGFHLVRTALKFNAVEGELRDLQVIEFGKRG